MDMGAQVGAKVTLSLYKIPRCPKCETSNPEEFQFCKLCGEPAPEHTDFREVEGVVTPEGIKLLETIDG